mmetsp:Transcript_31762/g.86897  ORF Transcript_31762/g.86897 Transcript_31762/m.86897 type:complete len:265 (-) Transcript_31762:555-1349(-)
MQHALGRVLGRQHREAHHVRLQHRRVLVDLAVVVLAERDRLHDRCRQRVRRQLMDACAHLLLRDECLLEEAHVPIVEPQLLHVFIRDKCAEGIVQRLARQLRREHVPVRVLRLAARDDPQGEVGREGHDHHAPAAAYRHDERYARYEHRVDGHHHHERHDLFERLWLARLLDALVDVVLVHGEVVEEGERPDGEHHRAQRRPPPAVLHHAARDERDEDHRDAEPDEPRVAALLAARKVPRASLLGEPRDVGARGRRVEGVLLRE